MMSSRYSLEEEYTEHSFSKQMILAKAQGVITPLMPFAERWFIFMKCVRKLICCLLVLSICMSLSVTAFAKSVNHATYGTVTGTSREVTGGAVRVSTSVSTNPDRATLRNSVEFSTGSELTPLRRASSTAGARSLSYDFDMQTTIDDPYVYAFCGHEVYRSLSSAVYFQTEVDLT